MRTKFYNVITVLWLLFIVITPIYWYFNPIHNSTTSYLWGVNDTMWFIYSLKHSSWYDRT